MPGGVPGGTASRLASIGKTHRWSSTPGHQQRHSTTGRSRSRLLRHLISSVDVVLHPRFPPVADSHRAGQHADPTTPLTPVEPTPRRQICVAIQSTRGPHERSRVREFVRTTMSGQVNALDTEEQHQELQTLLPHAAFTL